jgi:hypothetical protein
MSFNFINLSFWWYKSPFEKARDQIDLLILVDFSAPGSRSAIQIRTRIRFQNTDPDPLSKYGSGSAFQIRFRIRVQIRIWICFPNTDPDPYPGQPNLCGSRSGSTRPVQQAIKNPTVSGSTPLGVVIGVPFEIYTPNDYNLFLLGHLGLLLSERKYSVLV